VRVDVYSDVVCPWCYVGEKRLEKALARTPGIEADIRWRPFQLLPGMPEGGLPWAAFVREKFGGEENARAAFARVAAAGAPDGARFDFGRVANAPNTVDAHRLILFAGERGRQWEAADALFEAYFAEGADLNDHDQLAKIAARAGLDLEEARNCLAGGEGADEVARSQKEAHRLGINGVPFYVLDGRYAVSGAQPVGVFVRALEATRGETGD
jgi:predicted DsbA family dithiol-disulfide isomerase